MNILDEIIAAKRVRLAAATAELDLPAYCERAFRFRSGFPAKLLQKTLKRAILPAVIAEIKRRSPSKGELRPDLVPADIAFSYERAGAVAISVLTEEDYFAGSLDDLNAVMDATARPVLRKDFIVDEYQVYETALSGADALLLIVAALDDTTLGKLLQTTEDLGLDALVEVHTEAEMKRAVSLGAGLIGVNNRNLSTFEVSLDVSLKLAELAPPETIMVAESGISTAYDINLLRTAGYRGFLIGETFMKADDPGRALRELIGASAN